MPFAGERITGETTNATIEDEVFEFAKAKYIAIGTAVRVA